MHECSCDEKSLRISTRSPSMAPIPSLRFGRRNSVPKPSLYAAEALLADDRLAVDEVALERREHLLIRHLDGAEDGEAAQHEAVRGQQVAQPLGAHEVGLDSLAYVVRQLGARPLHLDIDETSSRRGKRKWRSSFVSGSGTLRISGTSSSISIP